MRFLPCAALLAAIFSLSEPARAATSGTMPSCSFNDPVVWVNTSTKVYHLKGDPYYGNTKHGQYECKSAADSSGNHLSKQKGEGATSGTTSSAKATPRAAPSPSPSGSRHHHHKSSGAKASPSPAAT